SVGSLILASVCACCLLAGIPKHVQPQGKSDSAGVALVYEVVSIKPAAPNSDPDSGGTEEMADGYKATNVTLLTLIRHAYGINIRNQISGGPGWLSSDAYDIRAKMDESAADRLKKLGPLERKLARQQMLQALLADRFKLTVHHENRELPVYVMVVAKNGPKLYESKFRETGSDKTYDSSLQSGRGGGKLLAPHATTRQLAELLTLALNRTVLDKTALISTYDITLQWTADQAEVPASTAPDSSQRGSENTSAPNGSWPSIFAAIQEQLGLKLEEGKGPVEIIVIDHVERPSGN
ncbi:MAG TPA: TIGR03435 family protein, partial [Candidatus Acidoferrales bacterium]